MLSKYQKIFDELECLEPKKKIEVIGNRREIGVAEKSIRLFITKNYPKKFEVKKASETKLKIIWRNDAACQGNTN